MQAVYPEANIAPCLLDTHCSWRVAEIGLRSGVAGKKKICARNARILADAGVEYDAEDMWRSGESDARGPERVHIGRGGPPGLLPCAVAVHAAKRELVNHGIQIVGQPC